MVHDGDQPVWSNRCAHCYTVMTLHECERLRSSLLMKEINRPVDTMTTDAPGEILIRLSVGT